MEIGDTAVQTRMALDLAVAEFRGRVAAHGFLNSGQLSPLCHHPLELHRSRAPHGGQRFGEPSHALAPGDVQRPSAGR